MLQAYTCLYKRLCPLFRSNAAIKFQLHILTVENSASGSRQRARIAQRLCEAASEWGCQGAHQLDICDLSGAGPLSCNMYYKSSLSVRFMVYQAKSISAVRWSDC